MTRAPEVAPPSPADPSDLLGKVAAAYASYRAGLQKIASPLELVVAQNLEYYNRNFFSGVDSEVLSKTASVGQDPTVDYLYGAYRNTGPAPEHWKFTSAPNSLAQQLLRPTF